MREHVFGGNPGTTHQQALADGGAVAHASGDSHSTPHHAIGGTISAAGSIGIGGAGMQADAAQSPQTSVERMEALAGGKHGAVVAPKKRTRYAKKTSPADTPPPMKKPSAKAASSALPPVPNDDHSGTAIYYGTGRILVSSHLKAYRVFTANSGRNETRVFWQGHTTRQKAWAAALQKIDEE
jgi:hypothetical protein